MTISDTDFRQNILNINKARTRAVYCRNLQGKVVETLPLPADPQSVAYYRAKGFSLGKKPDGLKCPMCDLSAKDANELEKHFRTHVKEEKMKEET